MRFSSNTGLDTNIYVIKKKTKHSEVPPSVIAAKERGLSPGAGVTRKEKRWKRGAPAQAVRLGLKDFKIQTAFCSRNLISVYKY